MMLTTKAIASVLIPKHFSQKSMIIVCVRAAHSQNGFNHYEEGRKEFNLTIPDKFNFVKDCFDVWASRRPQNTALWWIDDNGEELKFSYAQLSQLAKRVANALESGCHLKHGDRLIAILPKIPEWWILNLACIRTGIVLCPGTTLLTEQDIESRLKASRAHGIVVTEANMHIVDRIEERGFEKLKKIVVGHDKWPASWYNFKDLMSKAREDHACVDSRSDEPMNIFFTSGTTGAPKMTEISHACYGLGHAITGRYWLDLTPNDVMWANSDTGWAKAAYGTVFAPWYQGSTVFVHNTSAFDPEVTLKVLQDYPISTFCTVPTAYRLMIQQNLKNYDLSALKHSVSAGEPLNPEAADTWHSGTGIEIREGYGQTETVLVCGSFKCFENRPGSMGKPSPGFDIIIMDENGNEAEPYVEGDLAISLTPRPVGLFTAYVNDEEKTSNVMRHNHYITGDRAYKDKDGYIWFVGRADDVIISAGYRIGPFEVESALLEHPAVVESAVVSSPDSLRGEIAKAFVVLANSHKHYDHNILTAELQNHVKTTTAPYKYPRKIEFVDSLPKTVSGKIRRVHLRQSEKQTVK